MIFLLIIFTFLAVLALVFSKNGFLGNQFRTYQLICQQPYLHREFVLPNIELWENWPK